MIVPRRRRCRWVSYLPPYRGFYPFVESQETPQPSRDVVILTLEEFEALRLRDYLNLGQSESAERMGVSQPTFHRILSEAHRKVADALINGKGIQIEGGHAAIHQSELVHYTCPKCGYEWDYPSQLGKPKRCPNCGYLL